MKGVFTKKLTGAGPQAEARQMQQEAINRMRSGETGRVSRERALAGLVGASAVGGSAAKKMLEKQAAGISRAAAHEALGTTKDVVGMGGKMRVQDIGLGKADKTADMKFHQLQLGEKLAKEGMKAQVDAARAGAKCFSADTKISTPSGQVYIKDVKVGDEVLSFNDEGQISVNIVSKVFEHEPGDIYKLSYWGGEVLVTSNHWILEANNTFLQVDKFNTDHCLVDEEGSFRPFKSLEFYELDKTYNITVENDHTYIANGIRVHNFGGGKAGGGEIFKKYAKGGYTKKNGKIKGAGTETSDSIKARLSDGEFVVNAKTVRGIGEALGAKGKQPTRQKGSAYLYALQSKYGDTKAKDPKGLIPGYFGGAEVAKIAQQAAASGLLGEKAQVVGKVAGAGMEAQEKGVKAKAAKSKKAADEAFRKKQTAYYDKQLEKGKPDNKERAARTEAHPMMQPYKKGGDVKFGKGVKVRKKFLDSIGHKPFKHFEDKAEKDYKEGQTGYKNIKKQQSSSVPGFDFGITAAVMTAASMAKAEADRQKAAEAQKKQQVSAGEQEAAKGLATTGKSIMKADTTLKDGGKVQKRSLLQQLDDYDKKHKMGKYKRKPIDLSPEKKSWEAVRAKKGSIEPMKFDKGGKVKNPLFKKLQKGREDWYENFLVDQAKKKYHKREVPEDASSRRKFKELIDRKKDPLYKKIMKAERKGKSQEVYEKAVKKAEKAVHKKETAQAKKRFHEKEKPEFLDVAKEKILKKQKDMASDPNYKEIMEAQRKGKRQEVYEKAEVKARQAVAAKKAVKAGLRETGSLERSRKLKEAQLAKQAAGEHDVRQASKRKDYKRQQEIKAHAAKVAAEAAAREKKDLTGDASHAEYVFKREKARKEAAKKKVAPKVDAPEVKEKKKKKGDMTEKDWAEMGVAGATSLLGSIAASKKAKADRKRAREKEIRDARRSAGKSLSEFGRGVMQMDTRLKKGGKVSFKDVLKAKKKMGY